MTNGRKMWKRIGRIAGTAALVGSLTLSVGLVLPGCEKKEEKKAPPPPPPPPPPKEPDPVDMKGLSQTMKADKRLVFADSATTNKEGLAKAVIDLGDAIARGDEKKFSGMIDPMSREHLKRMVARGDWKEVTSKITQVRLVRLTPGADPAYSAASDPAAKGFSPEQIKLAFGMMLATLNDEAKTALKEKLGHDPTEADFDALMEQAEENWQKAKSEGKLPPQVEQMAASIENAFKTWKESKEAKPAAAAPKGEDIDGAFSLTFALQLPGEAHALAWVAVPMPNDKWTFKASGALQPPTQKRASDFDSLVGSGGGGATETPKEEPKAEEKHDEKPAEKSDEGGGKSPKKSGG